MVPTMFGNQIVNDKLITNAKLASVFSMLRSAI